MQRTEKEKQSEKRRKIRYAIEEKDRTKFKGEKS
jgi:hypothetical protein